MIFLDGILFFLYMVDSIVYMMLSVFFFILVSFGQGTEQQQIVWTYT
jgi:hypothetical protein